MATTIRLYSSWYVCERWFRVIGTVLNVELSNCIKVIHMSSQDVEDACRIAKHLKMGVKEKDGEIHLEEAADWYTEYSKLWLEKDPHKVLKAIGLEDLEAWKKKYNIVANNGNIKLNMLIVINSIYKSEIQLFMWDWPWPAISSPQGADGYIEALITRMIAD
jgi:hypothetical protein